MSILLRKEENEDIKNSSPEKKWIILPYVTIFSYEVHIIKI